MARKRYRQIDGVLVEITDDNVSRGVLIIPDLPDFRSPVDGTTITGRASLREHNKRNNVTFAADFKETWDQKRMERDIHYSTTESSARDKRERIESIKYAIEAHR